jgi:integrase
MRADRPHKFSTRAKAAYVGRAVSKWNNRGDGLASAVRTMLNDIRSETGLKTLSKIDKPTIEQYLDSLRERLESGELLSAATADRVSALNTTLRYFGKGDQAVSAKEYGLSRGPVDTSDKSNSREASTAVVEAVYGKGQDDPRSMALYHSLRFQEAFGLRARESLALKIAEKDPDAPRLIITKGDLPKNSRPREIPIVSDQQRQVLWEAKAFALSQGWRSLIPPEKSLAQGKDYAYKTLDKIRQSVGHPEFHFHGERHQYAHERFASLFHAQAGLGLQCPAVMGLGTKEWREYAANATGLSIEQIKDIDKEIRLEISEELGHSRVDVTRYYLG